MGADANPTPDPIARFVSAQVAWEDFAKHIIPDAPPNVHEMMRGAFFSGAWFSQHVMVTVSSACSDPKAEAMINRLIAELEAFKKQAQQPKTGA